MQQTGNYGLVDRFQKSWMYSKGPRHNLMKLDYARFGYGIVADPISGQAYAAQEFTLAYPQ